MPNIMTLPKNHENALIMDGVHVSRLRDKFTFSSDAVDRIFDNAATILSRCPGPGQDPCDPAVGIMIGKVQSGKTSNFIGLSALAMDNGYPLIIILGGTKNNLVDQNCSRIKDYFDNSKDVHVMSIGGEHDNSSNLQEGIIKDFIDNDEIAVLVVLKKSNRIDSVTKMLKTEIGKKPVLIIDDEGDEASLNGKAFKQPSSATSTYQSIVSLIKTPHRCGFISVTATAQANYLLGSNDILSPKFGILIRPGDGYCGLSIFHGDDKDRFYREIPDDDSDIMEQAEYLPESFKKAFAIFFVGAALRRFNGDSGHHAMLIHITGNKGPQFDLAKMVKDLLSNWNRYVVDIHGNGIPDDTYSTKIEPYFLDAYEDLRQTNTHLPEYTDLEFHIIQAFKDCQKKVLVCNGDLDDSADQRNKKNNIFIGGNKLQRGITIDGLAVTYMTRRAKKKSTVDTTEQRARWFGYRMKYLNVCRIYTTSHIERDYSIILRHEQKLWDHIGSYLEEGYEFSEIPRLLELDDDKALQFTRSNVARAKRLEIPPKITQSYVILDNVIADQNQRVSDEFYNSNSITEYSFGTITHHIAYDVPFHIVKQMFFDKITLPDRGGFSKNECAIIEKAIEINESDPLVDVIWMRYGKNQSRTIDKEGRINQLMSGSNSSGYPGDLYFDKDIGKPTNLKLQIHFIYPKGMDEYHAVMALHMKFSVHFRQNTRFIRGEDLNEQ